MKKLVLTMAVIMALVMLFGCTSGNFMTSAEMLKLSKNPELKITLSYEDSKKIAKEFTLTYELQYDKAPITVTNFVNLVNEKFYDNSIMHNCSVSKTSYSSFYYISGGAYKFNSDEKTLDSLKKDYTIKGEFEANGWDKNDLTHKIGNLVMDRTSGSTSFDTASTKFYICMSDYNSRNGNYAVFGILKSMSGKIGDKEIPEQDEMISVFFDDMMSMSLSQTKTDSDGNTVKIPTYTITVNMTIDTFGTTFPTARVIKKK